MAYLKKSRSRKPIAKGFLSRSWGNDAINGETFVISVQANETPTGKATWFTLQLDRNEAFTLLKWIAPYLATPLESDFYSITKRKNTVTALRELADMIEGKTK